MIRHRKNSQYLLLQDKIMEKKRMNRKLIRPNFAEYKEKMNRESAKKKSHPPFETHAENYYYLKQMNKKTRIDIVFLDGEKVEGYIEWYDKHCIKLNREKAPNLLIFKQGIKYIQKKEGKKEKSENKETRESKKPAAKKKE